MSVAFYVKAGGNTECIIVVLPFYRTSLETGWAEPQQF